MAAGLVLANGTVVTPDGVVAADVVVEGEVIADILPAGTGRAASVIEVRDRLVLPGGIDAHVHFLIGFMGQRSAATVPEKKS